MLPYAYPRAGQCLLNGEINFGTHTFKMMLLTSSYTPNLDTDRYQSAIAAYEITGGGSTGYVAGGKALTGVTIAYDSSTDTAWVDCDDVVWNPSNITARYAAAVDVNSGSAATNPLVSLYDLEANKTSDNAPFTLAINAAGLFRLPANV